MNNYFFLVYELETNLWEPCPGRTRRTISYSSYLVLCKKIIFCVGSFCLSFVSA